MPIADIQIQRSLTNTPVSLLFGEFAWSDSTSNLYIGNSAGSPILLNKGSLQQAYNASTTPEIITNATLGAFTLRRGSDADTDNVFEVQTNVGLNTFTVTGEGTTTIAKAIPGTNLIVAPTIADPQISTLPTTIYSQATTSVTNNAFRAYFNSGTAATSGYINLGYDAAAPYLQLLDMDDDPSYIDFSTARLGLSTNPGTFAAPAFINRFGARGTIANALSGFNWLTNGGVSGGALTSIMSCDTNFLAIPVTTTAARPVAAVGGMIEYNTTLGRIDAFQSGAWTQFVDNTTTQTIAGNKTFSGKSLFNTNIQQVSNATLVTTVLATFTVITTMSITTTNTVVSKYRVNFMLNMRHSSTNTTTVEIQIFVDGVADATTLYSYTSAVSASPITVSFEKIYTGVTSPTTYDIRWRRVSGTATVSVTTKFLNVQEVF